MGRSLAPNAIQRAVSRDLNDVVAKPKRDGLSLVALTRAKAIGGLIVSIVMVVGAMVFFANWDKDRAEHDRTIRDAFPGMVSPAER